MSTRCNIIITDDATEKRVQMYHHHDGYPEGVGADLKGFLSRWPGEKPTADAIAAGLNAYSAEYEYDGPDTALHGDIEYLYIVDMDEYEFHLRCYSVTWDFKDDVTGSWDVMEVTLSQYNKKEMDVVIPVLASITDKVDSLDSYSDSALFAELKRRGYRGTLTMTKKVEI